MSSGIWFLLGFLVGVAFCLVGLPLIGYAVFVIRDSWNRKGKG